MTWQDHKTAFEPDGSWRDIYISNTNINDWQKVLDYLRESAYDISYRYGYGVPIELPKTVQEVFAIHNEKLVLLTINIGGISVNSHFFTESEIEFDIDPREIDEIRLARLFDFMQQIGNLLEKEVVLTEENAPHKVIFKYVPDNGTAQLNSSNKESPPRAAEYFKECNFLALLIACGG